MPTTPQFKYRYPAATDPPNGPLAVQQLAEDVEAGGLRFAGYTSGAATSFPVGSYGNVPFANALDTTPGITREDSNRRFVFAIPGVWRIEAGCRVANGPTAQTQYLAILDSVNSGIRYAEEQCYQSGSGGSLAVARTRRFTTGQGVYIGVFRTGSGTFAIATDTSDTTFVTFTWVRP